jgi:hypothetical protein
LKNIYLTIIDYKRKISDNFYYYCWIEMS